MAQCSQSPSFSLIIIGRRGSRWSGPSPSYSQIFFFHTGWFVCSVTSCLQFCCCPAQSQVRPLLVGGPGKNAQFWAFLGHIQVMVHSLLLFAGSAAWWLQRVVILAMIDVGMVGGMGVAGRWVLSTESHEWEFVSGLTISPLNDYYGSELAVFKLRCAPRSRFRVANTQQCGQRSLVRTGWLDGCLRVWVTKVAFIRSLVL